MRVKSLKKVQRRVFKRFALDTSNIRNNRKARMAMFTVGFAIVGAGLLMISHAAGPFVSLESESATLQGVTTVTDTTASKGSAIKFGAVTTGYQQSLALIKNFAERNHTEDNSPWRNTPSADLYNKPDLYTSYTNYLNFDGEYNGDHMFFDEYQPGNGAATFRAECEVSHFSYDDPIVYPGQPGAAHLHMFFGNTDTNAYSTYDTLLNSGGSTCNGGELNRTAYWVPAMFDGQGNVVVPSHTRFYYKTEAPIGVGKVVPYPDNLQMVKDNANNAWGFYEYGDPNLSVFRCNDIYNGNKNSNSMTIPTCTGVPYPNNGSGDPTVLEYEIFFDYCWNGNTSTINNWRANRGLDGQTPNLVRPLYYWHSSNCPADHPYLFPALVTHIFYDVKPGEDTSKWFLSSDVDPNNPTGPLLGARGATAHADWFGAWNKQINQEWVTHCSNTLGAECATGFLADPAQTPNPRALRRFTDYISGWGSPNARIPVKDIFNGMCQYKKTLSTANGTQQGAYCRP